MPNDQRSLISLTGTRTALYRYLKAYIFRNLLLHVSCFSSYAVADNIRITAELKAKKKYILECGLPCWDKMKIESSAIKGLVSINVTTRESVQLCSAATFGGSQYCIGGSPPAEGE
jgi:hypothetical protein